MTKPGQGQPFSHLADLCKATQQTNSQNPEERGQPLSLYWTSYNYFTAKYQQMDTHEYCQKLVMIKHDAVL